MWGTVTEFYIPNDLNFSKTVAVLCGSNYKNLWFNLWARCQKNLLLQINLILSYSYFRVTCFHFQPSNDHYGKYSSCFHQSLHMDVCVPSHRPSTTFSTYVTTNHLKFQERPLKQWADQLHSLEIEHVWRLSMTLKKNNQTISLAAWISGRCEHWHLWHAISFVYFACCLTW